MTKNTQSSLENLQRALAMELTAANQYLLHSHVLDDWGLDLLAVKMREEMNEELGHASGFIDRILFLGGKPDLTPEKTPVLAETLEAMFTADLADEKDAIAFYSEAARQAMEDGDIGTRTVFESAVLDEEGHMA
ncbi:bacterioferritin [uncultured Roseobacter sp.]|uniref:bacterioferritin n=1 Tax=uncultured Roseobacter sp. TaxID=114847 RepID=UPI002613ED5F|nr:bacterioferritin [uncultured Roseobacter sp.]